jgi:hypothetical protein
MISHGSRHLSSVFGNHHAPDSVAFEVLQDQVAAELFDILDRGHLFFLRRLRGAERFFGEIELDEGWQVDALGCATLTVNP